MTSAAAAVTGAVLGILTARVVLVGSGWCLLPWSLAGLTVGAIAPTPAARRGAVYGFTLSFVFLTVGYDGQGSLVSRMPFFAGLGVFGAVCGAVLAIVGKRLRERLEPPSHLGSDLA